MRRRSRGLRRRYGRAGGGGDKSIRYSGDFKIVMQYRDDAPARHRNGYYKVLIKHLGRDGSGKSVAWRGVVGTPASLSEAVDSLRAYDSTARAALAFADDEGAISGDEAAFKRDGSGYFVTGRKSHRFGFLGRRGA